MLIVRGRGWCPFMGPISSPWDKTAALDIIECIEVVYSCARIHSALGYMSPAELEEVDWPDDEGCPRAA